MAFQTSWNGIGFDVGVIRITGDDARYKVKWGDGQADVVQKDRDEDGDGTPDSANPLHVYTQDGTYDVTVDQLQAGLPPIHMKAFMYSTATNDLDIGGTRLDDIICGGSGNDSLKGADGNDTIGAADGNDKLKGEDGNDFLLGGMGDDGVSGGNGSDLVVGNEGNDVVHGDGDRDYVYGDIGNDRLFGDDGDDYLQGDAGADRLTGGAGADQFEFAPTRDGNGAIVPDPDRDIVTDYQQGVDHLSVDQWFAGGAFALIGSDKFTGAGDEVRFASVGGGTLVFGDVDGDKVADFSFRIDGAVTLTNDDFVF